MIRAVYTIIISLCSILFVNSVYGNLNNLYKTSCLINSDYKVGSGNIIKITDDKIYILTAGHVLYKELSDTELTKKVTCEFFFTGFNSDPINAQINIVVYHYGTSDDFAIISIDKQNLLSYAQQELLCELKIVKDYNYKTNEVIQSAGCPNGGWSTCWIGHIKHDKLPEDENLLTVTPKAIPGRSGSSVVVSNNIIIGIIIRTDGTALSIKKIITLIQEIKPELLNILSTS